MTQLPVRQIETTLLDQLRQRRRAVLTAPTGSGKTTQVPQMLWESQITADQIIVLQPRRLATRLVATRVAREMNCPLGDLVGYQVRHESRTSPRTRIRFMTEGLLLRLLQSQPTLPGIGAVVIDEFHERSLPADTALALVRQLQQTKRPDLHLLVMSATLDTDRLCRYLDAPCLEAHGRTFPVALQYLARRSERPAWELAADALTDILTHNEEGDVLIFMPGAYEIRRTIDACQPLTRSEPLALLPLHGELPPAQQDAALAPRSERRVIVSTNVAETSITIEGIRHVIDSGQARVHRYDPRRGINVLRIEPISQASADQRAGRAGRTAPGTCRRLWPQSEHRTRPAHSDPEIARVDLAEVTLQMASMGVTDVARFDWLEPPDPLALERGRQLLVDLGALDAHNRLTAVGRQMASLPMHPRLSRMLIEAEQRRCLPRAALWAAFISERDLTLRQSRRPADVSPEFPRTDFVVLEQLFNAAQRANFEPARCDSVGVHGSAARDVERATRQYLRACADVGMSHRQHGDELADAIKCLLRSFPDHVAIRRNENNLACALVGQRRGVLDEQSIARHAGPLLAVEIREVGAGSQVQTRLSVVSELHLDWLAQLHPQHVTRCTVDVYNETRRWVERLDRTLFDDLILEETARGQPDAETAAALLAQQVHEGRLKLQQWDDQVEQWIARTRFAARWFPEHELITYDDEDIQIILQEICSGATRYSQIEDRPCYPAVRNALSWEEQQFVEQMAPDRYLLPGGWKMKILYNSSPDNPPRGRAKIQDLYGLNESPRIAGGRQKLTLEILGPNYRPVQLTDDLANFWTSLYPVLRKELSRKYPRHEWR